MFRPTRINRHVGRRLRTRSLAVAALIRGTPTMVVWINSHYKATCARIEDMKRSFAATVWRENELARLKRTALGGRTRLQEGTF